MWPRFDFGPVPWVFWFSEGFLRGSLVYLPLQKPTSPNSNSTKIEDPWKPAKPDIWPPLWIFLLVLKCLWNEFFAYFSMILWFGILEFILRRNAHEFFLLLRCWPIPVKNVPHSPPGQNMQINAVDVTRWVKPSGHHDSWEEQAKEWKAFRYRKAGFSELQNTTYPEGTFLHIFPKDKVRRAHC